MRALKVALILLAGAAVIQADADPKKSSKKSEKTTTPKSKLLKPIGEDSKTHKRGLYPDPLLGSTYALPGAVPLEVYHSDPVEDLSINHDGGVYGGVYSHHLGVEAPVVAATYAPEYGFEKHGGFGTHGTYTTYDHGYLGGFPGGLTGLEALLGGVKIEEGTIRVKTITTHVPVPVPHPVPVEVIKKVPVPVEEKVPVDVPRAVPVEVPQPYTVEVEKPYPVEVPKPVPHLVPYPVHYKVPQPYPVEVPTPYEVEVHKPVPVPVPHHVEVPHPVAVPVHTPKQPIYHSTPKPYVAPAAIVPAYTPTPAPAIVSVTTPCDDVHGLSYPSPTSIPFPHSFAKDIFSVSAPASYDYHPTPAPSYHKVITPVKAYPTPAPVIHSYSTTVSPDVHSYPKVLSPVVSITPVPVYPTAVTPVVSYPKVVTPVHPYPTAVAVAPVVSYPKAVTPAIHYPTVVPPAVAYAASEPCDHDYYPASVPAPAYLKPQSYDYGYSAPAAQDYGYSSGVATSFVGVSSHGSPAYRSYRSAVNHPQMRRSYQYGQ